MIWLEAFLKHLSGKTLLPSTTHINHTLTSLFSDTLPPLYRHTHGHTITLPRQIHTHTHTLPGCVYTSLSFHHSSSLPSRPLLSLALTPHSLCLFSELLFALCHRPFTDLALICPLCSIAPLYWDKIAQNIQTRMLFFCLPWLGFEFTP